MSNNPTTAGRTGTTLTLESLREAKKYLERLPAPPLYWYFRPTWMLDDNEIYRQQWKDAYRQYRKYRNTISNKPMSCRDILKKFKDVRDFKIGEFGEFHGPTFITDA